MIEMKYLKNNLRKLISVSFLIFGILLVSTVILPNKAFGQRDLSVITKGADVPYKNLSEECRLYQLTIYTGDLEGAEQDASVFVTINGERGSTDRIELSGLVSLRRDNHNPNSDCRDLNTNTPVSFVAWDANQNVIKSLPLTAFKPFQRNRKTVVTINAYDVGRIDSVTLQHDNWYPNWFLRKLELSSDGQPIINREVNRWFRPGFLLKQTFPVRQPQGIGDYLVSIYTGDVYQGGTNANASIVLNRADGSMITEIRPNEEIPGNPLERNQTDYTGLYNRPLLSDLRSITVSIPVGQKWFLGNITINGPSIWENQFPYNNWVEGGKPVTLYPDASRTRKITYRNEGFYDAQMMVTYTKYLSGNLLPHVVYTPYMPLGQNSVLEIPADVQNLKVLLIGYGTVKNDVYVSDFVGKPIGEPCFKTWGSGLSPQGGTCDGEPVEIAKEYSPLTLEPPKPTTAAQKEAACVLLGTEILPAGIQRLDDGNVRRLCKGSTNAFTTIDCFYNSVGKIGQENAIAECSGQIPLGSSPLLPSPSAPTNLNIRGANASTTNIPQNEQECFNQVQGKVAYDTAGNKVWNDNNIKNLCRGTTNPSVTISCFSSKMPQIGWAQATQQCAVTNISSQTQRVNQMPIPSQNQPTSTGFSLEGSWEMYNDKGVKFDKFAKISQSGSNLAINNGYGANSTAVLNGNSLTTSDGLSGTISPDGTKISWTINYVWVKQLSVPVNNRTPVTSPNSNGTVQTANSLGTAKDIDAKNGAVWIIGTTPVAGGYGIYKFNGAGWSQIDGGATRIAVDNTGNPWIVNEDGMVFRRINNAWTPIPGPNGANPLDIAISNSGEVWIVTDSGTVSRWTGSGWNNLIALSARRVIFTPNPDTFQIVDQTGKRFVRQSGTSWIAASDASGMADKFIEYAVDGETRWGIDSSFNIQKLGGGNSQGNYTVADTQNQPSSQITNTSTQTTKRSITFRNEAGFAANMMISYFEAGPGGMAMPKFLFSDNIPVGQNRTLEIPNSAPNMQVTVSLIGSGTVKDNFYSTSLDAGFTGNRCFKAWGTLFSPQGGTCQ
jgi:hypothetical protein